MKKSIGTEYRNKLSLIINSVKDIITPQKVAEILGISQQEAGRILSRWNKQSWVKRVKRGVYIPVDVADISGELSIKNPWILANGLFTPGYIGGFSAIKHWDFSEQIFETTTFFTTKKIKERQPIIGNTRFLLKTISKYKIFGTKMIWVDNIKIAVSDPSKTLVDLFDDPSLVGGMRIVQDVFLEYQKSKFFDVDKLITYAERMRNKTIFKRMGFLFEKMGLNHFVEKYNLTKKISKGYSIFDPLVENNKIIRKWKLKIPEVWKEYDR